MTNQYINLLTETMGDLKNLTSEKLSSFMSETLVQLMTLQNKINSKDEQERAEGLNDALELKKTLEKQIEEISKTAGLTPEQIEALPTESAGLEEAKKQLQSARKATNKKNKINLIG